MEIANMPVAGWVNLVLVWFKDREDPCYIYQAGEC